MLKRITKSPYLNLASGLVLLFTAGYETIATFGEALGAHHGLLFLSIAHILKVIPEIMHGLSDVGKAKELAL